MVVEECFPTNEGNGEAFKETFLVLPSASHGARAVGQVGVVSSLAGFSLFISNQPGGTLSTFLVVACSQNLPKKIVGRILAKPGAIYAEAADSTTTQSQPRAN